MKALAVRTIFPPMGAVTTPKRRAYTDQERDNFYTNIYKERLQKVIMVKKLCRMGFSIDEAKVITDASLLKILEQETWKKRQQGKNFAKRRKAFQLKRLKRKISLKGLFKR